MMGRDPMLHPPLNFICEGNGSKCIIVAPSLIEATEYYREVFSQDLGTVRAQQVTEDELYDIQQNQAIELDTFVAD